MLASLPQMLANIGHYSRWREDSYLADIAELTGQACSGVADGDQSLQGFIASARPQEDAALVRILHRKLFRDCLIVAGPNAPADHIALSRIEPVLHLDNESQAL